MAAFEPTSYFGLFSYSDEADITCAMYSLSAVPAGMAPDKFGGKRIILLGVLLFSTVYNGFAVVTGTDTVWLLFATYGIFMGLTEGVQEAFLSTIIPGDFKAMASGLYNSATVSPCFRRASSVGWLRHHYSSAARFYFGSLPRQIPQCCSPYS
jgi:MFS family permease